MRNPLVAYVLTRDEEQNIARAVSSLLKVTSSVVVVDSGSTDRTVQLSRELGATVLVHQFDGFSKQRNWAIDQIVERVDPEWILSLDADEYLSDELALELADNLRTNKLSRDVYLIPMRVWFDGRVLRWGGFANTRLPRLYRPTAVRYENRDVNEHVALAPGSQVGRLRGHFVHSDVASWERHIAKHNRYSTLEAKARVAIATADEAVTALGEALGRPHLRRRWLREHVWNHMPARPAVRFIQIYILALGFLDRRAGFRRAVWEAWQEMCTDLKAEALVRGKNA